MLTHGQVHILYTLFTAQATTLDYVFVNIDFFFFYIYKKQQVTCIYCHKISVATDKELYAG